MSNLTGITWEDAAARFKAAGLPCSTRQVRRYVADHPALCPVEAVSYHVKRLNPRGVARLIAAIQETRNGKQSR